jgi:hypothetical protein
MPADMLCWLLKHALDVTAWGGEHITDVELSARRPVVIAAVLPVRLGPWAIGDMLDRERAGPYLGGVT